ncbi:MAG: hypothetical protein ACQESR_04710 [Planctomycetota bacterium]
MRNSATTLAGLGVACLALAGCVAPQACYRDYGSGEPPVAVGGFPEPGMAGCADCGPTAATGGPCAAPELFPGRPLLNLLRGIVTCGAGCGRVYYGEWQYDPPDACDPCNNHGDFVGPTPCGPSCWQNLWRGIHGVRCGVGGAEGACLEESCMEGVEGGCMEGCGTGCAPQPAMEPNIDYNESGGQPSIMLDGEPLEWDQPASPSFDSAPMEQMMPEPQPEDKSAGPLRRRSRVASEPRDRSCLVRPRNR